ncbi:alpha/beta hydrolase [Rummeliibacillus sp. NPDC094406]|uniref:alpha/beta hydrolase n=1 Tax=Rummeliibacillus sp. NPDC094406 TaxID=3364511 RepID=UPI0037F43517
MKKHFAIVKGKGNDINLFLPGLGWTAEFGLQIAEELESNFVTHMLDLPGIGRSEGLDGVVKLKDIADWIEDYIIENQLEKVNLIGHSLGGICSLSYAIYYPHRVNQLILLDTGYSNLPRFPVKMMGPVGYALPIINVFHKIFGEKALGKEMEWNEAKTEITEENILKVINTLELEDNPFIRNAIKNQPAGINLKGISLMMAAYRSNLPKMTKKLKVPCLILYGNQEKEPTKVQFKIKKKIKKIKNTGIYAEELKGGHHAHASDPAANKYIKGFLLNETNPLPK